MDRPPSQSDAVRLNGRTVALALSGFWVSFVAMNTLRMALLGFPHQGEALVRRMFVALVGVALAAGISLALTRLRPRSVIAQVGATAAMSLPAALVFAATNFLVFEIIAPIAREGCAHGRPCTFHDGVVSVSELLINWFFVFLAWGLVYLSLRAAELTRQADRRAEAHREIARLAEIRALRYQINPHFLFNLLNSLSALIISRKWAEAETLIGEIGRFFRHSLAADPVADTPLADEVEMQARYLELERRRFPDRLVVEIDLPEELASAATPSLVLQPLIENAVKHGVGASPTLVTVRIQAAETHDRRLRLVVEDNAQPASPNTPPQGLGIGLKNVADRLRARFGEGATCTAGPRAEGGFRVELLMPLVWP